MTSGERVFVCDNLNKKVNMVLDAMSACILIEQITPKGTKKPEIYVQVTDSD